MYKFNDDNQISFFDFNQSCGMQLDPENEWVKLADRIPWDRAEQMYAVMFPSADQLRFDFNCDHKLTNEELSRIEALINDWIRQDLQIKFNSMNKMKAVELGAEHEFIEKYPDIVKVYQIGDASMEICSVPHVCSTAEMGSFKILKEKSSSRGIRRIVVEVD